MKVEDISAVDMPSTRICRLDNVSGCVVEVENAAALLENSSSELAIIVVVAFMLS